MSESPQALAVELDESDISELRESGELKYRYFEADGANLELTLYYDGDGGGDDDDDDGSGFKVSTTLH